MSAQIINLSDHAGTARRRALPATRATYDELSEWAVDLARTRKMINDTLSGVFALCTAIDEATGRKHPT